MVFDAAVAAVTLTGSVLSFLATSGVLISFIFYHDQQRSFRHALILNLTLAEFMNSLDNTISGIIYIKNKELQPGAACVLNGMIGQLSVQASDFSILAIAVVTFLTITQKTYMPTTSTSRKIIICLSIWIVPLVTSITATAMGTIQPVSGNWCWITRDRPDLRYALTHGWRFGIIFTTILIYMYVWWYLGRHFRSMASTSDPLYDSGNSTGNIVKSSIRKKQGFEVIQGPDLEMDEFERPRPTANEAPRKPSIPQQAVTPSIRKPSVGYDEDEEVEQSTRPSQSSRGSHFLDDKMEEEPRRKMSSRISRFDNDDLDMSQASEARFSYLEQEDKLHISASGGPSHLHQDMPPPVATRFSRYGMSSFSFGSGNKRTNRSRSSTVSWSLPPPQELRTRDFPPSPGLQNVNSKQAPPNVTAAMMSDFPIRSQTKKVEREIKRMMLLNAYPIMYVALWIPGLVNRLMEASGNNSQSRVLAALQSSSQYIGFANAITYGFNQHVRHRVKGDIFNWFRGR
ncbi:G protein-coupled glucose receptor regulating Gpa2-domain-containing protein [Colletotrichum cereale]|nr:G protein-coupled glucose receptor regulating Gpa2-domain-containing protein [Colletotrichum cereale]